MDLRLGARYRSVRWLRWPPWLADALLALFVTAVQIRSVAQYAGEPAARPISDFGHAGYLLLLASGAAIVLRRRLPVPVFGCTVLLSLVYFGLGFPDNLSCLSLFVAMYTLTAYGDGRRSLLVAGAGTVVLAVGWLVAAADIEPQVAAGWVFLRIGATVISTTLGESVRSRRVLAAEAHARAERAERSRETEARSRVDAERLRIAREVHDTVAHAIAVINVQSGVTAHVLDRRPEQAREALRTIEQTSSRALHEMRTILGVLRDGDDREPCPGLGQLPDLTAKARAAGLDVAFEPAAPAPDLPTAVDSAAYRIVQESITNVLRHVGPTRVTVAVRSDAEAPIKFPLVILLKSFNH